MAIPLDVPTTREYFERDGQVAETGPPNRAYLVDAMLRKQAPAGSAFTPLAAGSATPV